MLMEMLEVEHLDSDRDGDQAYKEIGMYLTNNVGGDTLRVRLYGQQQIKHIILLVQVINIATHGSI